jgi:hypothetical protein
MRNKCFHGVWGYGVGSRKGDVKVAAKHYKDPENPVTAHQLPALEKKLCRTARLGWDAITLINEWKHPRGCARMFHGRGFGDEGPPWLPEWSEQHRLDDAALDRRHKQGQLPYLTKPW